MKILEKIKKYKWRLLLIGDLGAMWYILHLRTYIHHTDLDLKGGGSWCTKLWLFITQGVNRQIGRPTYVRVDTDLLYPLYLLGFAIFLLGIFIVKAWHEQKRDIIEGD